MTGRGYNDATPTRGVNPMRLALPALLAVLPALAAADWPHKMIAADARTRRLAIVAPGGELAWDTKNRHDVHDAQLLPDGNLLTHTTSTNVVEISPDKKIVWEYVAKPVAGGAGRVEVHSFQRLPDGLTMVAESGNARIVEVNRAGEVVKVVPLAVGKPDPHRDTRRVRKLATGNYLVAHEGQGLVREYGPAGATVWEYKLDLGGRPASGGHGVEGHGTAVFSAVRLENGNTLIGGGNNNRVLEVNPAGEVVWELKQDDIPGVTLAWVTGVQRLANGNTVVGNCHAGPDNPQVLEVSRDKKLVASFKDFKRFGDALATSIVVDEK